MNEYKPLDERVKADKAKKIIYVVLAFGILTALCVVSYPRCILWQRIVIWILSALLFLLYVLKTGIIRQFRDTSWEGTVTGKKIKHAANKNLNPRDTHVRLVCVWFIEKSDGEKIKLKIDTDEINETYFAVGEKIRHTAGTRYPTRTSVKDHNYICPMCGHASSEARCSFCRTDYKCVYDPNDPFEEFG